MKLWLFFADIEIICSTASGLSSHMRWYGFKLFTGIFHAGEPCCKVFVSCFIDLERKIRL